MVVRKGKHIINDVNSAPFVCEYLKHQKRLLFLNVRADERNEFETKPLVSGMGKYPEEFVDMEYHTSLENRFFYGVTIKTAYNSKNL